MSASVDCERFQISPETATGPSGPQLWVKKVLAPCLAEDPQNLTVGAAAVSLNEKHQKVQPHL